MNDPRQVVLARCKEAFPRWRDLSIDDVDFDAPKGFSSYTMAVRPRASVAPVGAFYRQLEGKENAILDFEAERATFLLLGDHEIAAHCHAYHRDYRIEAIYSGRTLLPSDLRDPHTLRGIADQLYRLHQLEPDGLPDATFFELLHAQWGPMARRILTSEREHFPRDEQKLCEELLEICEPSTLERALNRLPPGPYGFCHNDTYHGNVMRLDDGAIRLLDFEFSCRNHIAFDFANLFAETTMVHGLPDPPHFRIAEPSYGREHVAVLVDAYLDNARFASDIERLSRRDALIEQTLHLVPLSDFMYAMAALPLATNPIQKIRFLPYAHQRFRRFLAATD